MKQTRLSMLLLSLGVSASMLLSACGAETPTATPVPAAPTTAPAAAATDTTAPAAAATDTTAPAAAATATTGGSASSGDVLKIAVDLPVSGGDATDGIPTRNGVQLAIDQANAAGGVTVAGKQYKLEMYFLDDVPPGGAGHDPAQGSKNADAFIADPAVMAMIGPFNSNVATAMMPKLNQAGLANVSPSNTGPSLTKPEFGALKDLRPTGNVTYFRVCTTDDIQGPVGADYAYDKLGAKKVYILDDTETYGKGLADQFEKEFKAKGGTVLGHDGVPKGTTDYSSILTKIASAGPDLLYYGGTSSNNIPLARKQMKAAGLDIPLMGGDGIVDAEYVNVAAADAEGSYGTVAAVNAATLPSAQKFLTDYKAAFGSDVGAYSANAYDATQIVIDAIKRATAPDRASVLAALKTTNYNGVIGNTSFDANGDTTNRWISIYEVKSGAWSFVDQQKFSGSGSTGGETPTAGGAAASGGTLKIAVDLPVSGGDATDGIPTRNGVQLAIDQANAAGGVTVAGKQYKLEMYFLDDVPPGGAGHDPAQGSKNADAFIADPAVMAMIGPFNSNVATAMMPKLNQAGLANVSPSNTGPSLTKPEFGALKDLRPTGNVTYFRVCTTDDIQGPVGADYAYDKLGAKKVYILDDTETYGKGLADQFEKEFKAKGGTVLGHDGVPKGTTDYSSILTKIASAGPDLLYYGGTSSNNIPLARKQMKAAGLDIPLMGGDGIVDAEYVNVAAADAEGSYGTVAAVNAATLPSAQKFLTDYKAAFGSDVGAYSANAYDATQIVIDAIKRATAPDRASVLAALKTTNYNGVIGNTSFDANGDTTNRWISIYEVKSGAWSFVDQQKFTQ